MIDSMFFFYRGGASLQFCMIPMNFLRSGVSADYVDTGTWSNKAIKEAEILGKSVNVVASSENKNYTYIPRNISFSRDAVYHHITSNNTIKGTQWPCFPDTGDAPIVADMSSDIMSRPFNTDPFGLIYAGAQKNVGPAGVCLVIIHDEMLDLILENLPTMLNYRTFVDKNSLFNTPPCFAIYAVQLVLKWLEVEIGGLEAMAETNNRKASQLYGLIDSSDFYTGTAEKDSRSIMNITFRLPTEELENEFVRQALQNDLGGLKGHQSVGGCRASLYNATTLEAIDHLIGFMKYFEDKNG